MPDIDVPLAICAGQGMTILSVQKNLYIHAGTDRKYIIWIPITISDIQFIFRAIIYFIHVIFQRLNINGILSLIAAYKPGKPPLYSHLIGLKITGLVIGVGRFQPNSARLPAQGF